MLSVQNVNGARFVVDDVEVARNSLSTESRLTPGTHKLLVEKPGFRRHRATIFVPRTGTMDPVVVTMIPDDTE
jgi:hypothetical protein